MPELIDAAAKGDIALVLAIGLVTLSGVVGYLFKLLLNEKTERVRRAEELTDRANDNFDGLEESTKTAVSIAQAALDELRRR